MSDRLLGLNSIVLDTDVASMSYKGKLTPPLLEKVFGRHVMLPFVAVGEMTAWTVMRAWGGDRTEELQLWLDSKTILDGDEAVAFVWGRIHSAAVRAGRTPQYNDSWIAACCLAYGVPLVTNNTKDFQYFADHHGLVLL